MALKSSILLTYKGKILLFAKDIIVQTNEENTWDFLRVGKVTNKNLIEYLSKEMNVIKDLKDSELSINQISTDQKNDFKLFHLKLSDENVNSIIRNEGWRLEFYRFDELNKIFLNQDAIDILRLYKNEILALLKG